MRERVNLYQGRNFIKGAVPFRELDIYLHKASTQPHNSPIRKVIRDYLTLYRFELLIKEAGKDSIKGKRLLSYQKIVARSIAQVSRNDHELARHYLEMDHLTRRAEFSSGNLGKVQQIFNVLNGFPRSTYVAK